MKTKMLSEILETKEVLKKQWTQNESLRFEIAKNWNDHDYYSFVTVARGSSDHAASFINYLIALKLGKLTTSLSPSLISVHAIKLTTPKSLHMAVSQSGRSPDLLASIEFCNKNNFSNLVFVNKENSPLAKMAQNIYPLRAGEELSVAATKSFMASIFAGASIIAQTSGDQNLLEALAKAPNFLPTHTSTNLHSIVDTLKSATKTIIVGRGLGLAIAQEAALKLKETCYIQASAFSGAEVLHGPQAIIEQDYPIIIFAPRGPEQKGLLEVSKMMRERGAKVFTICNTVTHADDFSYTLSSHKLLDPLNIIYDFYLMVEELARTRGIDPDKPRFLAKETLTT